MRPRDLGEALGADAVETERDDRLAGLLVEAGAGVGQPIALQHRLAFDRIRAAAAARQHLVARRQLRARQAGHEHAMEAQLRGGLQERSRISLGSCTPGSCTRMRSPPSRWMVGSATPWLVDAPAHDLEALIDRRRPAGDQRSLGRSQLDRAVRQHLHVEIALRLGQCRQRHGRNEPAQHTLGLGALLRVGDPHGDGVGRAGDGADDARLAQRCSHPVDERIGLAAGERGRVDLEHEVRAAFEVQPQCHLLLGQPTGQGSELLAGEQIGRGDGAADENHDRVSRELPARGKHGKRPEQECGTARMRGGVPGVVPRTSRARAARSGRRVRRPASGPAGRGSARLRDERCRRGEVNALAAAVVDAGIAIGLLDVVGRSRNRGRRWTGLRVEAFLGRGLQPRRRIGLDRGAVDAADRVDNRGIGFPGAAGDVRQGGGRWLQPRA